jgi:hypothetical protein
MSTEIQNMLKKHNYLPKLTLNSETGVIKLHIPSRVQEPPVDAYTHDYLIGDNKIYFTMDGDNPTEVDCPDYACRCLIFVDIKRVCEYFNFNTFVLEFYYDEDKISETEFFDNMLPKSVVLSEASLRQERDLKELLSRAMNAIIPYHETFNHEAQQMGVGLGYGAIATFAIGANNE